MKQSIHEILLQHENNFWMENNKRTSSGESAPDIVKIIPGSNY